MALVATISASAKGAGEAKATLESSSVSDFLSSSSSNDWSAVYGSIDNFTLSLDGEEKKFDTSFTLGVSKAKSLKEDLFLEAGVEVSAAFADILSTKLTSTKMSYVGAAIPVNVAYNYVISDKLSVVPFAGLSAKFGIAFSTDTTLKYTDLKGEEKEKKTSINHYDSDKMGDEAFNRFVVGSQIGVNVHILDKFIVGLKWQKDLTEIHEDITSLNSTAITLGYKF